MLRTRGWNTTVLTVEVGSRGFVGKSLNHTLRVLGCPFPKSTLRLISERARHCSYVIWCSRKLLVRTIEGTAVRRLVEWRVSSCTPLTAAGQPGLHSLASGRGDARRQSDQRRPRIRQCRRGGQSGGQVNKATWQPSTTLFGLTLLYFSCEYV